MVHGHLQKVIRIAYPIRQFQKFENEYIDTAKDPGLFMPV